MLIKKINEFPWNKQINFTVTKFKNSDFLLNKLNRKKLATKRHEFSYVVLNFQPL